MAAAQLQNRRTRIVFDGQSLNNVPGDGTEDYTNPYQSMPYQVVGDLDSPAALEVVAVNGTSWTTLLTTQASRSSSKVRTRAGKRDVLFMQGGQSDVTAGDTGAQIHADMATYADNARAAGFDIVIASTIPLFNPFGIVLPGSMETARTTANALLLADAGNDFDAVVDLDVAPIDDPDNHDYFTPPYETHWTPLGAAIAADIIRPVLEPFILA